MRLAELAAAVPGAVVEEGGHAEVSRVVYDSRAAGRGDLFVAITGYRTDGHRFAADAAARGAAIAHQHAVALPPGTPRVHLADSRMALGELAAEILGRPARQLLVAGVTGTDGKTTTSYIAEHVIEHAGIGAGLATTVGFRVGRQELPNETGQSTTEAPEMQGLLAQMLEAGARCAVIETTSHALVQGRVVGCEFDVAAFTNVGFDHLDYHSSWDEYLQAKASLIDLCAGSGSKGVPKTAILNHDDVSYERLAERPIERRLSYSIEHNGADLLATDIWGDANGSRFRIVTPFGEAPVELRLPARFNVSNALCAAGICLALGLSIEQVADGLSTFRGVRGRLEPVDLGQDFRVFIDFAHSAGALKAALAELRPLTVGRLIVVFGSTARSDHDRPGMGAAAAEGADFFVITTDDPVDQDPAEIAREVQSGVGGKSPGRDYEIVLDRRRAIRRAMEVARPGDVVLLAGKGHERTMYTASGHEPWDERAVAEEAIRAVLATA